MYKIVREISLILVYMVTNSR